METGLLMYTLAVAPVPSASAVGASSAFLQAASARSADAAADPLRNVRRPIFTCSLICSLLLSLGHALGTASNRRRLRTSMERLHGTKVFLKVS